MVAIAKEPLQRFMEDIEVAVAAITHNGLRVADPLPDRADLRERILKGMAFSVLSQVYPGSIHEDNVLYLDEIGLE